ncbi:unnamed protein product [Durusdinium trenchii]|uniref:Uncharacterized protein n=2 Tax=Durusdinium trenchii TaxID=1381693 RepID=A0ABP0M9J2_9DINO
MVSPPSISNEVLPEVYGAAEGSEGSEGSTELGTRVEESELLKLLRSAGLEEWHSKLLSFGYETVDDVRCMDEHCMEEIGLRGGHRIRLERVLPNTVVKLTVPQPKLEIHSLRPPLCQEGDCTQIAGSKCHACNKLLCLAHVKTIQKSNMVGNTAVIKDIPACSTCNHRSEDEDRSNRFVGCAVSICVFFIGTILVTSIASA